MVAGDAVGILLRMTWDHPLSSPLFLDPFRDQGQNWDLHPYWNRFRFRYGIHRPSICLRVIIVLFTFLNEKNLIFS